jgi:hypothetical protein
LYSYSELKSATQAAALAGGEAIITNIDAKQAALKYTGRTSSDYNYHPNLNVTPYSVTATVNVGCIDPAVPAYANYGIAPCTVYGPNNGNAVQVTESTTVPTYFARIFGKPTVNLSATVVSSATGGAGSAWNVAMVVDTTASMSSGDPACGGISRIQCSINGVQTLLKTMTPCLVGSACTAANAIDNVSMFTFPNITSASAPADYCGGGNISVQPYTFPSSTPTSAGYAPGANPTYQILGYGNNYQVTPVPKAGPALSGSSNLSKSSGAGGCAGLKNPGGAGTYYAGVIYAAQASLMQQQLANPGSKNAMIILSDGDATATKTDMAATATASGLYPSYNDECQQAVTAAAAATALGTRIYTVAYGVAANQNNTCTSDKKTGTNPTGTNITACQTIQAIGGGANSPYFYSDANSAGAGCNAGKNSTTSLNNIFLQIGSSLTTARLLPGNVAFTAH